MATVVGGFNTENKARDTRHWFEHQAKPSLLMQEYTVTVLNFG